MKILSKQILLALVLLLSLFLYSIIPTEASTGGRLFFVEYGEDGLIYELDPSTGEVLNSFPTPEPAVGGPVGLAYCGGRMFFVSGFGTGTIYELNPEEDNVINSFTPPESAQVMDGMGMSPDNLFVLDYVESTIYVLNPDSGAIIDMLTPAAKLIGGGTYAGTRDSLFFTGYIPAVFDGIFEIDPDDGTILNSFEVPDSGIGLGFSSSRNTLFVSGQENHRIYEVNPDDGTVINSFPTPSVRGITALAADECGLTPPVDVIVGGEIASESQVVIIAPWIALAVIVLAGGIYLVRRRAFGSK